MYSYQAGGTSTSTTVGELWPRDFWNKVDSFIHKIASFITSELNIAYLFCTQWPSAVNGRRGLLLISQVE